MAEPHAKKCNLEDLGQGKFQMGWIKVFPGIVDVSKLGSSHAFCKVYNKDVKVVASSLYDLNEHFKTKSHERNFDMKKGGSIKTFFAQPQQNGESVIWAKVLFANFVAQHNLPASVADHFTYIITEMFPDSGIAKKVLGKANPAATEPVIKLCREMLFSLMVDESNDKKTDKRLAIMVSQKTKSMLTKVKKANPDLLMASNNWMCQ